MKETSGSGLYNLIAQVIEEIKDEQEERISLEKINLAELQRHIRISLAKLPPLPGLYKRMIRTTLPQPWKYPIILGKDNMVVR